YVVGFTCYHYLYSMSSYEVIVNGYYGMPMDPLDPYVQLVMKAPPSPDYIPGPEAPPSPDYIPGPEYPEYLPPADDVLPAEEQPLPAAVSPTADGGDNDADDGDDLSEDDADDEEGEESLDTLYSSVSASEETEPFEEARFTTPTGGYEVGENSVAAAARQIRPALTIADRRRADDRLIGRLRREGRYFRTLSTTYVQEVAHSRDYCTQIMDYCQTREVHTSYSRRFQELALMCDRTFLEESDRVEKYIDGVPDTIHDSVKVAKPKTMQESIEFATELMDKMICDAVENKRKFEGTSGNNQYQPQQNKRQNTGRAYAAGNSDRNIQGIYVDPAKIESIKDWAPPKSPMEIRQFLGVAEYQKELNMKQHRWLELLSDYDCEIRYHPGKANVVADALCRKEQEPLRVRALVMTISLDLPKQILNAQTEARKPENIKNEYVGGMLVENAKNTEAIRE
nr:putative reverse transcriptase domain-containing protein [Tanacetum cinerariifolium]